VTSNIRKDRMRPAELLGIAAALAAFVGLIVALSTRRGRSSSSSRASRSSAPS
jgi:hypothetical protein